LSATCGKLVALLQYLLQFLLSIKLTNTSPVNYKIHIIEKTGLNTDKLSILIIFTSVHLLYSTNQIIMCKVQLQVNKMSSAGLYFLSGMVLHNHKVPLIAKYPMTINRTHYTTVILK
jgi:hypothetical protein